MWHLSVRWMMMTRHRMRHPSDGGWATVWPGILSQNRPRRRGRVIRLTLSRVGTSPPRLSKKVTAKARLLTCDVCREVKGQSSVFRSRYRKLFFTHLLSARRCDVAVLSLSCFSRVLVNRESFNLIALVALVVYVPPEGRNTFRSFANE